MPESPDVVVIPAKAVRLSDMIRSILDELHEHVADDVVARDRLAALYAAALVEVGSAVSDSLLDELASLQTPAVNGSSSVDEIRVAIAQLGGWVLGLLVGTGEGLIDAELIDLPLEEPADAEEVA